MPSGVISGVYYYSNPSMPLLDVDYGGGVILPSAEAHFYDVSIQQFNLILFSQNTSIYHSMVIMSGK